MAAHLADQLLTIVADLRTMVADLQGRTQNFVTGYTIQENLHFDGKLNIL